MRGRWMAGGAIAAMLSLGACDPCFGVSGCTVEPQVSYTGQTIDRRTGDPVAGVEITFLPAGDGAGAPLTARSGSDGFFRLSGPAPEGVVLRGRVEVRPPAPYPAYTVDDVALAPTIRGGDGGDLGRWAVNPFIAFVGEVRERVGNRVVPNATVRFRRLGGVSIGRDTATLHTDAFGRFFLGGIADGWGTLEAEFIVSGPSYPGEHRATASIPTEYLDRPATEVRLVRLGLTLQYVGEVYRRGNFAHAAGLQVVFQRTGGIMTEPARYVSRTNALGLFPVMPIPREEGEVIGDLTISLPAPHAPLVVRGVRMQTSESDELKLLGRWGYGAQIHGQVEFHDRTTGLPVGAGIPTVFRRVSGPTIDPDPVAQLTNEFGRIGVQAGASAVGVVTGEIEVRLPAPDETHVVQGVRATARDADDQDFWGVYRVGRWFPQVALALDASDDSPIVGARVEFRRTSGIAVDPAVFVTTTQEGGIFPIRPRPLANGEVVGDLHFFLPAPFRDTVIAGVRLQSSTNDTLRLLDTWRFTPSP